MPSASDFIYKLIFPWSHTKRSSSIIQSCNFWNFIQFLFAIYIFLNQHPWTLFCNNSLIFFSANKIYIRRHIYTTMWRKRFKKFANHFHFKHIFRIFILECKQINLISFIIRVWDHTSRDNIVLSNIAVWAVFLKCVFREIYSRLMQRYIWVSILSIRYWFSLGILDGLCELGIGSINREDVMLFIIGL